MRIMILSNYYPPYYIGGYELACYDTVEFLKKAGHEVHVLTGDYKSSQKEIEEGIYRKLKYIDYSKPSYLNKYEVESYNYDITKEMIETVQPDIVYVWSLRLVSLSPLWVIEKLKIKKIFEVADFWMKGYLSNSLIAKTKRVIKNVIPFCNSTKVEINPIICVSNWMKTEMKALYGTKTIFEIPNGTQITNQKSKKSKEKMKYMFCGRVDFSKGLDIAIKALSNLKDKKISDFEFHIYGDGDKDYLFKCKTMVKLLQLEKEVFFHGRVDDVKEKYENNHILLMPTRMREPFGLVLIEAMNYGVIPIASNAYGPSEIIENNKDGLLFSPFNIEDLTNKILQIHNNWNMLEKYKQNAYEKVSTKFDLNIVKKKVESILVNLSRN